MNRSDMRQLVQMQTYLCLQLHGLMTLQLLKRMSLQLHMVEHLLTSAGVILPTLAVPAICVPPEHSSRRVNCAPTLFTQAMVLDTI